MLTLIGAGGIGKTRLAVALARSVSHHHPDGVVWVELAPVRDPILVSAALAAAIGLRDQTGATPTEALAHHLRGRQMLIVLDNCEHLIEACSALVHALVEAAPEVRVLSTSREPLRVAGETTYRVPSLAEDDARQLFKERATAAGWRSDTAAATTSAVLAVCRRLDCIPLAVELRRAQGALGEARRALQECLVDARRLGERYLELWGRVRLGRVLRCQHDYRSAADVLSEALDDAQRLGNGLAVAETIDELALLAATTGDPRLAAVHFGHADRLRRDMAAPVPPYLRTDHELAAKAARQALGDLEFSLAYAEGERRC